MKIGNFQSLRLKKEIKSLNNHGIFLQSSSFNIKAISANDNKVFFIIKKKIGNSPTRNTIKRQIRSIISKYENNLNLHIMFIVKFNFKQKSYAMVEQEINLNISKIILKLSNCYK